MKDQRKTKAQLIEELVELRQRAAELEASETEHERAQEAWRESEERYRTLFEQSRDAVNITTRDGQLLDANQAWLDLFGYTRKDIAGINVEELYADPADRRRFQDEMEENGAVRDYEVKLRKRDSTEMDCLVTSTVRRGDDGAVVGYQGIIRNITERKQADEALQRLMEFNESIVQTTGEGIVVLDAAGRMTFTNPACDALLGYEPEELADEHWTMIVPPDERPIVEAADERRARGESDRYELDLLRKDGSKACVLVHGSPRFVDGELTGTLAVFTDITERKRAEEGLRESEERYRSVVENSHAGIFIVDEAYRFIYVNDELCRILGYSRGDIVGEDFRRFLDDESRDLVAERYVRRQRGEEVCPRYEFSIPRKDGHKRRVEISSTVITDSEGRVRTVAQILDITERKKAEDALKRSETTLRSILRAASMGIGLVTNRVIGWTNEAFQEMVGYSGDELVGQSARIVYESDEEFDRVGRVKYAEVEKEGTGTVETRLKCEDGRVIDILLSSTAIDPADLSAGVVFTALDITERKKAEEALREYSERLEEMVAERTKELREAQEELMRKERLAILGQLAGGVSHELRNPLATISNAVYYLQMTLPDADKTTTEYLELISEQVHRAGKIVSDLLDFSRDTTADREEVAVTQLVREVLERQAAPERVKVSVRIPQDLPRVFVDARQIGQVLDNLVTNAYQAMPEGGTLSIRAEAQEGQVHVSVMDTGVGISKENMERLFEPLFSTKPRGIGLGLAVSKIFIEANRGSIEVESEEGKGSTFTVILPTAELES